MSTFELKHLDLVVVLAWGEHGAQVAPIAQSLSSYLSAFYHLRAALLASQPPWLESGASVTLKIVTTT
jgi:hypothetical protein